MASGHAYLLLEDGTRFDGDSCGAAGGAVGEVVFTTGMSGYQESVSDPSFAGQLIAFTYPHIGNYGASAAAMESARPWARAVIMRDARNSRDSRGSEHGWLDWLAAQEVPAITDVDTRALVCHIRDAGAMRGGLFAADVPIAQARAAVAAEPAMSGRDLARIVTPRQIVRLRTLEDLRCHLRAGGAVAGAPLEAEPAAGGQPAGTGPAAASPPAAGCEASAGQKIAAGLSVAVGAEPGVGAGPAVGAEPLDSSAAAQAQGASGQVRIAVLDTGVKASMLGQLLARGAEVQLHPCTSGADQLLAGNPDAILLANGPGDPAALGYVVETVGALLGRRPVWGICLGHQLLCRALGLQTFKLPFGHRGANHPVKDLRDGRIAITSQNHGFAVLGPGGERHMAGDRPLRWETEHGIARLSHVNLYDRTVEGLELLDVPATSVQYHPEAGPGPHDSLDWFERFLAAAGAQVRDA